jgi:DHA1 family chloramphenicol resistance protein-like MFS transporter
VAPAVFVLGASVFVISTSEFMVSGLLPDIASSLPVGIPDAGLMVYAFAAGMVVGAPVLAVATLRLPRRRTLLTLLTTFGLGRVIGAPAPGYAVLLLPRAGGRSTTCTPRRPSPSGKGRPVSPARIRPSP